MAISCAYCGASHALPAQVRECWVRTNGAEASEVVPLAESQISEPTFSSAVRVPSLEASFISQPFVKPGPPELARGLVIRPGSVAPEPWTNAPHFHLDQAVLQHPEAGVAQLTELAHRGVRIVVVMHADFHARPTPIMDLAPYEVGPTFEFSIELLHHLVWANSIDATEPEWRWPVFAAACALGAADLGADLPGDIQLPDGTAAWLFGGQIQAFAPVEGLPVLHAAMVEHGSLQVAHTLVSSAELAGDQRAAVSHTGASVRVIAPAGSGKTRVLTERARHLLNNWRVPPTAISLVAFNKRAQEEMQARTTDLRGLKVRTLNAIALAIVNGNSPFQPTTRTFRTIDETDVRRIIAKLVDFPRKRNTDPMATWIEALSAIRLGLASPQAVERRYNGDVDGLGAMWPRYRAALERDGLVDFDDQVYRAIEVLLTDPAARATAQRACRVLLVDEFQDLTPAHVLLIRLLSAPYFGVFGVGDDDQTIYGYSGADPAWLIEFEKLFPHAALHPLEVNYRCPDDIVHAADRLVRHNRHRVTKQILSARPDANGLQVVAADDTLSATVQAVRQALAHGRQPDEIAVLARVNALLAPVQIALVAAGVAVRGAVGMEFVERTAIRSALAWLRLSVADPQVLSGPDLAEALRRPSRPLHPTVATWVAEQTSLAGLQRLAGRVNTERDAQRINDFISDITRLQRLAKRSTTAQLLRALADDVGLGAAIATLDDSRRGMNKSAQNDDLVALGQLASLQPDPSVFGDWLRDQLSVHWSPQGVTLATVHRVKGQEWPVVIVHHAEADQFPHRLAEDLEEERRVFHVAITRAREQAIVVVGETPSPFASEMLVEPPPFSQQSAATPFRAVRDAKPKASAASKSIFDKSSVMAAPGLILVDGGQEWVVEAIDDAGAMTRFGGSSRRFAFGASVVSRGRQRGPLRPAIGANGVTVEDASVRAYDILRQTREQLRAGKPAYVVYDDATLERLALAMPTSVRDLLAIQGIGPGKLEQYGDAILLAIEDAREAPVAEN